MVSRFLTLFLIFIIPGYAAQHGIGLYGKVKYPSNFKHFEYVNPQAPKGGVLEIAVLGSFDSLNPFVVKGTPAAGLAPLHPSYLFATLLDRAHDEPFSAYGYVAKSIELAPDHSWIIFNLRPEARFHDQTPLTAEDVVFSFTTLKEKGHPLYRAYYREITKAEAISPRQVKFTFASPANRELPLIIGEMPILSKTYYQTHDFNKAGLEAPLGSGPYKIEQVEPGESITYRRLEKWWGKDLPIAKGHYNFNRIRFLYFFDAAVAFEGFKSHEVNFRLETLSKLWATGYDFPALEQGEVIKETIPHQASFGGQFFAYNLRRPLFQDPKVRQALSLALDFEWMNENLFYGLYSRTSSYFSNGPFAATALPQGEELEILIRYKDQLPPEVFTRSFQLPVTDGSGHIRSQLREAAKILNQAGWIIKDGKRIHAQTQQPLKLEILLDSQEFVKVVNNFVENLKRLGIEAQVRVVDSAQYTNRVEQFDFDMVVVTLLQSNSPGNEQLEFWGSVAAQAKGSRNYMGIQNPVIDELIQLVIAAPSRESLIHRVRALDRVLLWNYYSIPLWYKGTHWIAYWKEIKHPDKIPPYHLDINTWWSEPPAEKR